MTVTQRQQAETVVVSVSLIPSDFATPGAYRHVSLGRPVCTILTVDVGLRKIVRESVHRRNSARRWRACNVPKERYVLMIFRTQTAQEVLLRIVRAFASLLNPLFIFRK